MSQLFPSPSVILYYVDPTQAVLPNFWCAPTCLVWTFWKSSLYFWHKLWGLQCWKMSDSYFCAPVSRFNHFWTWEKWPFANFVKFCQFSQNIVNMATTTEHILAPSFMNLRLKKVLATPLIWAFCMTEQNWLTGTCTHDLFLRNITLKLKNYYVICPL